MFYFVENTLLAVLKKNIMLLFSSFVFFFFFCATVFATNFRVKAAMKNSVLLSWEIRDKNPAQPFTVSTILLGFLNVFFLSVNNVK